MKRIFSSACAVLIIISCSKPDASGQKGDPDQGAGETPLPYAGLPRVESSFSLGGADVYVDVMGDNPPMLPAFATVTRRPGKLRGYVKNIWGQPVADAFIGIRSSITGGTYSPASAITNNKGYYEMALPYGAVHYWAAGVTQSYGGGMAAYGLLPADGNAQGFASEEGSVENFVIVPYGRGDLAAWSERPWEPRNYFGGTIRFNYTIYEDMWSPKGSLPADAEIEIRLIPDGYLPDAREHRSFTILKQVGNSSFTVNNIPVGKYIIEARLVGSDALRLKAADFWPHAIFGMKPVNAIGSSKILFLPYAADAQSGLPNKGGWNEVGVKLELND